MLQRYIAYTSLLSKSTTPLSLSWKRCFKRRSPIFVRVGLVGLPLSWQKNLAMRLVKLSQLMESAKPALTNEISSHL
jgi:hypothetical protein